MGARGRDLFSDPANGWAGCTNGSSTPRRPESNCGQVYASMVVSKKIHMSHVPFFHSFSVARLVFGTLSSMILHGATVESRAADVATVGRPVRVVSFSFRAGQPLDEIALRIDAEGAKGVDLVILPETWRGQNDRSLEPMDGPTVQALAKLAKKHHTYIVSPIDCERGGCRFNTAVVLDRAGQIVGSYDKAFPYWSEFDHAQKVQPGRSAPVIQTDFGKLGLAICFDVNFPEVWQRLADAGAELVAWSSAYSAGTHLQAYALLHHFYIMTSTSAGDCQAYDLTGERILDERSDGIHISHLTLDLDRGIYHTNFNEEKKAALLKEHADEVRQVKWLEREQWFVLQALKPGVSARGLARQYGLEDLRSYISRSRKSIDAMRGWNFSAGEEK